MIAAETLEIVGWVIIAILVFNVLLAVALWLASRGMADEDVEYLHEGATMREANDPYIEPVSEEWRRQNDTGW